jgi:hypothetical protein
MNMVELRAYAFIDQLQKQMVGYVGSTARGYYPVAAALKSIRLPTSF